MLTQIQSNEETRFNKMGIFFGLTSSVTIIATYPPFQTRVTAFGIDLAYLNSLTPGKNADASGVTDGKTEDKLAIAVSLSQVCQKTKAYAIVTGNTMLKAQMQASKSSILKLKDSDIMGFVTTIVTLVTPLLPLALFVPYGITATYLATITSASVAYNGLIGQAGVDESGNAIANDKIDAQIKKMQLEKETMDLLLSGFLPTYPDFIAGYKLNSKTINIGVHHNGITGDITDSITSVGIGDAVVQLVGTEKITISNLLGVYSITIVPSKLYTVTVTAIGYVTQSKVVKIIKGQIITLDFEMVKA